jgi:hypothetical protein
MFGISEDFDLYYMGTSHTLVSIRNVESSTSTWYGQNGGCRRDWEQGEPYWKHLDMQRDSPIGEFLIAWSWVVEMPAFVRKCPRGSQSGIQLLFNKSLRIGTLKPTMKGKYTKSVKNLKNKIIYMLIKRHVTLACWQDETYENWAISFSCEWICVSRPASSYKGY